MSIIAFSNLKGGAGKSTTTVHLVWWLSQIKGKKVAIIDGDAQSSTTAWIESLELNLPIHRITDPDLLAEEPLKLNKNYDFVIIDNAGNSSEATRCTMQVAHLLVIPLVPAGIDMYSVTQTTRILRQMQQTRKGYPIAASFLNRAEKNTKLLRDGQKAITKIEGVVPLETVVYRRQSLADAFLSRSTAFEIKSAKESAREYQQLFDELMRLVK